MIMINDKINNNNNNGNGDLPDNELSRIVNISDGNQTVDGRYITAT